MAELKPYIPDLDKIAKHCTNPDPLILNDDEFANILAEYKLYRGTRLSDVGILRAMEAGLIKIWDPEEHGFDLLKQIKGARVDFRIDHHVWRYDTDDRISRLTMGQHEGPLQEFDLLKYSYRAIDEDIVLNPGRLTLALFHEGLSLSNAVVAEVDGRSLAGRLGISNHQTASEAGPGYAGRIIMEISNANHFDIAIPVHEAVGSVGFTLLDHPSSRPYNLQSGNLAYMQVAPFRYWKDEWSEKMKEALNAQNNPNGRNFAISGDPAHLNNQQ